MSSPVWIRTCQECGHKQETKPPKDQREPTDGYRNALCKACKSPGLDYGSYQSTEEEKERRRMFDSFMKGFKQHEVKPIVIRERHSLWSLDKLEDIMTVGELLQVLQGLDPKLNIVITSADDEEVAALITNVVTESDDEGEDFLNIVTETWDDDDGEPTNTDNGPPPEEN